MEETEIWANIKGFEGIYEVSSHGRVRSLDRVDSRGYHRRGRILKTPAGKGGYLSTCLCRDGLQHTFRVHRLVALSFIGPVPEGSEVCHNDGNPANNILSNLRYDSHRANMNDVIRHGTAASSKKTHCKHGHPFAGDNLRVCPRTGQRVCRACKRNQSKRIHRIRTEM